MKKPKMMHKIKEKYMARSLLFLIREIDNSFKHSTPPQDDTQTVGLLPSKPDSFPLLNGIS
jgi:hypothetical protein